jgi:hypothetical protein
VLAEKELADVQVQEAEMNLRLARDAVETAGARVELANQQLGEVLNAMLLPNTIASTTPTRTQHHAAMYNFIPFRDAPRHPWPQPELDTRSNIDSDPESCQDDDIEPADDDLARRCEVDDI